jgi:hypothetical protein
MYDVDINQEYNLNNKLFCTFTSSDELDSLIDRITSSYSIIYNKIFVFHIKENDEYAVTYNIEEGNINGIPTNTISVHRKKESNTLYTINALNNLIKTLNNGFSDNNYKVNWNNYKNCILLTNNYEFKQLSTKIFKIIEI